jgi:DNA-binding response OmpR family regulator
MASLGERTGSGKLGTAPLRPNMNVLVIEDDQDTALTIGMLVMREGYGVRTVASRDDALYLLSCYLYDVIIMDLNMPGFTAPDFVAEVKQRCPRSQIVLLTAAGKVNQEGDKLGLPHRLGKPFDADDLLKAIRACK